MELVLRMFMGILLIAIVWTFTILVTPSFVTGTSTADTIFNGFIPIAASGAVIIWIFVGKRNDKEP